MRYIADYTFHFNPAAVRKLLETSSVAFTPNPVKPVVVLPVLTIGGRIELWDDPNPWRDAWAKHAGVEATLPVVVPVGDLADVAAIDAPKALAGDRDGDQGDLGAIPERRRAGGAGQAGVGTAPFRGDGRALQSRWRRAGRKPRPSRSPAKPGESDADLMARAIAATIDKLGQSWKAANTVDPNISGTHRRDADLGARSPTGSRCATGCARFRRCAAPILLSFDRSQIKIAIRYIGDQNQFRAALGERGLALGGADPDWTLALHVAPAPAPAPPPDAAAKPDAGQRRQFAQGRRVDRREHPQSHHPGAAVVGAADRLAGADGLRSRRGWSCSRSRACPTRSTVSSPSAGISARRSARCSTRSPTRRCWSACS